MSFEAQVIDNFLPDELADSIESLCFSKDFRWNYLEDITFAVKKTRLVSSEGYSHMFLAGNSFKSGYFKHIQMVPSFGGFNDNEYETSRAVAFMQHPSKAEQKPLHNNKHVDSSDPHVVLLYYVIDSDGDTFLFSKDKNSSDISKRVTPKKNRALVFDGAVYHASSIPSSSKRCVINFNLISKT